MAIIPYGSSTLTNTYTATVNTSWTSNSAGYYTKTIAVSGILATDNPIIDLVPTTSGYKAETKAWGNIFKITTAANSITLYATKATETSISIQLKVVR